MRILTTNAYPDDLTLQSKLKASPTPRVKFSKQLFFKPPSIACSPHPNLSRQSSITSYLRKALTWRQKQIGERKI